MYKKVDTTLNFLDREKEVLEFWKENKIFEQNIAAHRPTSVFSDKAKATSFRSPPFAYTLYILQYNIIII